MFKTIKILLTTTMDLCQRKLTRAEWEGIEIPVDASEKQILELIKKGFHDTSISYCDTKSLYAYTKIDESKEMTAFLFTKYFADRIKKVTKKYNIDFTSTAKSNLKPKKKDIIRIDNFDRTLDQEQKNIYEFVIMELAEAILHKYFKKDSSKKSNKSKKTSNHIFYYYTVYHLNRNSIENVNTYFKEFVDFILEHFKTHENILEEIPHLIKNAANVIEHNSYLWNHRNITLYKHQKNIFDLFKNPTPKLVLYIAPTATGKTLTPIGLSETYRVIFVCAARHVGLALARNAISCGKKIALAFNCGDAQDIRLHFNAAKDCIRDWKSGAVRKVDNSNGTNVEIIISDIKSYEYAMYYMMAFNPKEKIITFWDEPTITMDYDKHDFHEIIHNNWSQNLIPNIILSSATLPKEGELMTTLQDYKVRFGGEIHSIISHDCKKTIPIIGPDLAVYLPHVSFPTYPELLRTTKYIEQNKTLLRYLDLGEIVRFVLYINEHNLLKENRDNLKIKNYFMDFDNITMYDIKQYYLLILRNINPDKWSEIYTYFNTEKTVPYDSNIHVVSSDSHTLTDGPTIFLTENIQKIAKFYLKESGIPERTIQELMTDIDYNTKLTTEVNKLEKNYEDLDMKENKVSDERKNSGSRVNPEMKAIQKKIEQLIAEIRVIRMDDVYIPNTQSHINKWAEDKDTSQLFTCDISEDVIIRIAQLTDIDASWKILLIMGIGVFTEHSSIAYTEIMKELANDQKLFMIIASSDYIYGTNYQFSHGYISKDLSNMTQEKTVQAMGRIGRNKIQQQYSIRFRDSSIIEKIFIPQENRPEVENMNKLFSS